MNNNKDKQHNKDEVESKKSKPQEMAGFYFSSSIRIIDPESKEILLNQRFD